MSLEYIETGNFAAQTSGAEASGMFRIVSWNINRGCCFDQVLHFLRKSDADLILLQECDLYARRSGSRNIAREIAQTLNMNYVFGAEFIELSQGESALRGQVTLFVTVWPPTARSTVLIGGCGERVRFEPQPARSIGKITVAIQRAMYRRDTGTPHFEVCRAELPGLVGKETEGETSIREFPSK